ncbi:MAG: diguanylate cyclase [Thalassotalea sp.]
MRSNTFLVWLLLFTSGLHVFGNTCFAYSNDDFSIIDNIEKQIYKEPWQSYKRIINLTPQVKNQSKEKQLLWLQRKATAENLLYFYSDFKHTVADARKLLTSKSDVNSKAKLIFYAGLIAQRDNEYNKATELFLKAMELAQSVGSTVLYIEIKQELAYTRSLTELFDASLKDMQSAYVEAFALNDEFLIAVINETYGAIYGYMNEYQKSIEYYQKAYETYEQFGYRAHLAEAVYGLASTYRYWKKYELAIEYFEHYQDLIAYTPNLDISYLSAYGLGMTLAEKGDCQRALKVIAKGLKLNGPSDYNGELYKRQSLCYIQQNNFVAAQTSLDKANAIFVNIPELVGTKWQLETIKLAGELAHSQNKHQQAFELMKEYYQKFTEQLIENASSRLVNVRHALELERKSVELNLLQQRTRVKLLEAEQAQQMNLINRYLLVFLSFVVVVIVIVMLIQRRNHQKVLNLSIKDDLTGLYNRRYIFDFFEKLLIKNQEKGRMSIMVLDIDNFKLINDQYGHIIGDSVLKQVADIAQTCLRTEDIMGRVGGEEFLCLLPRVDKSLTEIIAKRLLTSINQAEFVVKAGEKIHVSVSIGMRFISNNKEIQVNHFYAQADQALYRAKREGKNQAVMFQERTY